MEEIRTGDDGVNIITKNTETNELKLLITDIGDFSKVELYSDDVKILTYLAKYENVEFPTSEGDGIWECNFEIISLAIESPDVKVNLKKLDRFIGFEAAGNILLSGHPWNDFTYVELPVDEEVREHIDRLCKIMIPLFDMRVYCIHSAGAASRHKYSYL